MNDVFLILILIIIIALAGDNRLVRSVCGLGLFLIVLSRKSPEEKEQFTVIKPMQRPPAPAEYMEDLQFNSPPSLMSDRTALQQLQRGTKARDIERGMQKNRVNYMRPFFEEELARNDEVDWWNNERTYNGYV
jgi:hypothetical protein